ncbi:hypothetical protein ACQKCU_19780 [Heyndrickxia sporothermodurans]
MNLLETVCIEIREAFPDTWLLIESIQAHTDENNMRILDEIVPLKKFPNSSEAMKSYKLLHRDNPNRELYVLHTSRKELNIIEKKWVGVRGL